MTLRKPAIKNEHLSEIDDDAEKTSIPLPTIQV